MDIQRRSVLKGLAAAGLVVSGIPWAKGAMEGGVATTYPMAGNPDAVTVLVSGSGLDEAFAAAVHESAAGLAAGSSSLRPLQELDAATYAHLDALLNDGGSTRLVGLLDDASVTLVLELVRSSGGRLLSVDHHRIGRGASAQQWASALGRSLVASGRAIPVIDGGEGGRKAYVSLCCVI